MTAGELVDEVVLGVTCDGGEVAALIEVVAAHTVIVGFPERQGAASCSRNPFVVVAGSSGVFDVRTQVPDDDAVVVLIRSRLEVDGVEDVGVFNTTGGTRDGEDTVVRIPVGLKSGSSVILKVENIEGLEATGDAKLGAIDGVGEVDGDASENFAGSVVTEVLSGIRLVVSIREVLVFIVSESGEDEESKNHKSTEEGE